MMEEIRVFGVFEQLDSKIENYLTARTPPELFNLVFTRLEADFPIPSNNNNKMSASDGGMVGAIMALLWVSRRGNFFLTLTQYVFFGIRVL